MPEQITENVYLISIPLENSPLKNLNAYLVRGRVRNLLIDTGYYTKSCIDVMRGCLKEIGVDMRETDIFLTHLHSDHCGMAGAIASSETTVYMSPADSRHLRDSYDPGFLDQTEAVYLSYGFSKEELIENRKNNPAVAYRQPVLVPSVPVYDGQVIDLGGTRLTCVSTPGHTPGHMCQYDPERKILFAGDHIIYDITPNITSWTEMEDALGTYLDSLRRVRGLDMKLALSAHRRPVSDSRMRIDQLLSHHEARLEDVMRILQMQGGSGIVMNCYQIASYMKWSIRARNWEEFPVVQKFFAVGEAASHLDHLIALNKVRRECSEGIYYYHVLQPA